MEAGQPGGRKLTRHDFLGTSAMAGAGLLVLAGCGGSDSADAGGNLVFLNWVAAEDASRENIQRVLQVYEKQNKNIGIENAAIPYAEMRQQLLTRTSGGNPPDVTMLEGPWSQEFGPQGALLDLREVASEEYLSNNYEAMLDAGSYEGTLYAVPFAQTPFGLWYNKDIMRRAGLDPEAPPATMEELNQQMDQIKEELGSEGVFPIAHDLVKEDFALTVFWPWFFAFNARPLYGGAPNFDTPEVRNALQWLRDLARNEYTPGGQDNKQLRSLLADGSVAFKLDGPYNVGILRSLNSELEGDAFYDTFGVTTVPVGDNGESQTLALAHQLAISSQASDQAAAWEFIRYLTSSDTSIEEHIIPYGAIPPLKSEGDREALSDPVSRAFVDEIFPTMTPGPFSPDYSRAAEFLIEAMQRTGVGEDPIDQITQQTEEDLRTIFEG